MLATEDETTFSESKEVLESLCYEGTVLVSSRAVAASAFSNLLFFCFFEKIRRRRLKLFFFSLLEGRKSTGKGTLLLLPKNASLFSAWGMFWRWFRDHQTREKRLPAMSFPWFERCLDENCTQTSRKIGCFTRSGWDRGRGAIFSLSFSVLDMGEDILFCGWG